MVAISTSITAPILLSEYAQTLESGSMSRTFVENIVKESDVLSNIRVMPAAAGKKEFMDVSGLPTVGFRGINDGGGQQTGSFNLRSEDTYFMDEYIFVDRATVDRLGPEHRAKQENLKMISLAQTCSAKIIKGDNSSSAKEPNGLQVRCGKVNTNLIHNSAASGGAALSLLNLDRLIWTVNKPTHLIFPRTLMPYMEAAARNSTLTGAAFSYTEDDFGRKITKYKGLPILFGYEPDDTPDLLPMTEVASGGGGAVTGSIYCVRFDDSGVYLIEQTPLSVVDEGPVPGAPQLSTHIKWDWGIAREHPYSVSRLTSIAQSAVVA